MLLGTLMLFHGSFGAVPLPVLLRCRAGLGIAIPIAMGLAKGVDGRRVLRRHAGPFAYPATASLVGVSAPIIVINLVLVEHVFSVPGFFQRMWRATGHTDNPDWVFIDYPTLTGLAVWGSIFVVVLGFAMDAVVARLDLRVRAASRAGS